MKFGYARVSTKEQNLDSQISELQNLGCEKIFIEKLSGKNMQRPELLQMFSELRPLDVLIITHIDRLARSLTDFVFLVEELSKKNVALEIGSFRLDFSKAEGKLYANLFALIADFQRQLIVEKTSRGLMEARKKGRIGGKPKGLSVEAKEKAKLAYDLRLKGLTQQQLLKACDIKSKRTLYKYIKFEAERLSKLTGKKISDNGIDLIDFNEK